MRGKPEALGDNIKSMRITPACAGKTVKSNFFQLFAEDHPRVCGENVSALRGRLVMKGSPPRVRGKPIDNRCGTGKRRITPACAGKTMAIALGLEAD